MKKTGKSTMVSEEGSLYGRAGLRTRPHERLDSWNRSIELVLSVYDATKAFPKEETFGLTSQMRRAAVSVPANIAEGSARKNIAERKQFYYVSRASLSELETHITISNRLGYLSKDVSMALFEQCARVAAMLNGMIRRERDEEMRK